MDTNTNRTQAAHHAAPRLAGHADADALAARGARAAAARADFEASAVAEAACTTCRATPGTGCTTPDGRPFGGVHLARDEALRDLRSGVVWH